MSPSDYGNTRAAARRARLLGDRGVRDLLARPRTADRLAALADSAWARAVPTVSRDALPDALRGLAEDVDREAREVLSFLDGRPRRMVHALFRLHDASVLEAVLRGLARHVSRGRIVASSWPTPGMPPSLVADLAALPGPEHAARLLADRGNPLAAAAAAGVEALAEEPRLVRLGVMLQQRVVQDVAAEISGGGEDAEIARAVLAGHIDDRNAVTLLAVELAHPAAGLFVAGGAHATPELLEIATLPLDQRRAVLARWVSRRPGSAGLEPSALVDPALAAQVLARARHRALQRAARTRPFSIAVPLALVADRILEARRVAVVLLGAEHGLPADVLLDLVEA